MDKLFNLLNNIWNSLHSLVFNVFWPVSVSRDQMIFIDKVRQDWWARGFSCDLRTDPPEQVWNNIVRKVDELAMVIEGEMEFELEGEKLHPKINEEVFVPANVPHKARNLGKTPAHYLYGLRR